MRKTFFCVACLALIFHATTVHAEDDTGTTDPEDSQGSNSHWETLKARYEAEQAAYEAAEARENARKTAIEAGNAADLASLGTVTGQTGITGASELGEESGKAEAMLLASRATREAASTLAAEVVQTIPKTAYIVIATNMSDVAVADVDVFDFQRGRVASFLRAGILQSEDALRQASQIDTTETDDRMGPVTAVGGLLDIASKLGSYFQTDYEFGGVSFEAVSELDAIAMTEALTETHGFNGRIILPKTVVPESVGTLLSDLTPIDSDYIKLVGLMANVKARAEQIRELDGPKALLLDSAAASAQSAITAYESFVNGLVGSGEGESPISKILRQRAFQSYLAKDPYILLVSSKAAGAFYTKKNLWTFFGGPPLYTMGGVSMVYTIIDPYGRVLRTSAIERHGGYRSVNSVERLFASQASAQTAPSLANAPSAPNTTSPPNSGKPEVDNPSN